jgi:hypothetical protein
LLRGRDCTTVALTGSHPTEMDFRILGPLETLDEAHPVRLAAAGSGRRMRPSSNRTNDLPGSRTDRAAAQRTGTIARVRSGQGAGGDEFAQGAVTAFPPSESVRRRASCAAKRAPAAKLADGVLQEVIDPRAGLRALEPPREAERRHWIVGDQLPGRPRGPHQLPPGCRCRMTIRGPRVRARGLAGCPSRCSPARAPRSHLPHWPPRGSCRRRPRGGRARCRSSGPRAAASCSRRRRSRA